MFRAIATNLDVEGAAADLDPGLALVGEARGVSGVVHGAGRGGGLRLEDDLLAVLHEHGGGLGRGCKKRTKLGPVPILLGSPSCLPATARRLMRILMMVLLCSPPVSTLLPG